MIQITRAGVALCVSLLLVFAFAGSVFADSRDRFAQETGLDLDLISILQTTVNGTELTIVFVFINDRTFQSKISAELRAVLLPYVGRNAFYVNPSIEQVVSQLAFSPFEISVRQGTAPAFVPERDAWIEVTSGFAAGHFEVNPSGSEQGSGSEGILVLDETVDVAQPLELRYGGEAARFDIGMATAVSTTTASVPSAVSSHEPIEVAHLDETVTLEEILMRDNFSADSMAALLELDPDLVRVMELTSRGEELRLLLVRLETPIRDSALGLDLLDALDPLVGTGAAMVWAFSKEGAAFSPWNFYIKQRGTNYVFFSSASFVELTDGFLRTERVVAGEVAAGVIRLPKSVDNTVPFSIYYGTAGVDYP